MAADSSRAFIKADTLPFPNETHQTLMDSKVLQIPQRLASNVIMDLRASVGELGARTPLRAAVERYNVLRELEQSGKLSFNLKDVVTEIVKLLEREAIE